VAIEEACDRVLAPSVLLEAPTVAELAATLIRDEEAIDHPLTALRDSGSRAPIFFLHNDRGRGLYTHALTRAVDPDRPFYAVHPHGLVHGEFPSTVEALAADLLPAVRAARPRGPYVLGGHCHGGLVALEMARQLRAQGERVDVVVLVDTRAPGFWFRALHSVTDLLAGLRRLTPDRRRELFSSLDSVSENLVSQAEYYGRRLKALGRSDLRGQAEFVGRSLGRMARGLDRLLAFRPARREGAPGQSAPRAIVETWPALRRAVRRHLPPPYDGPVALFRAEGFPASRPDLGWSSLLPQLEVTVVPGDHYTCVTRHVGVLGMRLEETLRRAESSA